MMREVSKDEFFATVGQLNVHPHSEPNVTHWLTPQRVLMGQSVPGYMGGGAKKRWYISENYK